ncbi:MAG: leucine-rich repeat domain-containing protein [Clostridia bacterium]|nr:leucine-rich repeat domain-containing protein [Clostridia bacterium]
MKLKFLLLILTIMLFACLLTVSAGAISGSASDEFGEVTVVDGLSSVSTDTNATVVLKNTDGTFSTYYTYYIYPKFNWRGGMSQPDFKGLNDALGTSYDSNSIIRIQLLKDCKYIELPGECNTYLKELYIPENINTTTLYRTYFKALEKINIPSCITTIYQNTFDGTTTLKYVTFGENFSMTSLPNSMFSGCSSIEEIRLPNSVTSIGVSFFSGCSSLKTIYLSENLDVCGNSMLVNVSNAKMYASSKWFSTNAPAAGSFSYVGHAPDNITLFYVGTKTEAEALIAKSSHNGIKNATLVEYDATNPDDYYVNSVQTVWTIVYGYSKCQAFYGGHDISDELTLNFTDFTSPMQEMSGCTRNCGINTIVNEYDAIFNGYRISVKEEGYALCVSYSINNESINVYNKYSDGDALFYGVVASKGLNESETLLSVNNGSIIKDKENAVLVNFDKEYAGFDFVLRGFNESHENVKLIINAFVTDGKSIYYISSKTNVAPVEFSMAEIKSLN